MARSEFMKTIKAFVDGLEDRVTEVTQEAGIAMYDFMQTPIGLGGLMPVDTYTLQNSLQSSINGTITGTGAYSYRNALEQLKLGDTHSTVRARITRPDGRPMDYAVAQEYWGPPEARHFTTGATSMWLTFVEWSVRGGSAHA